MYILYSKISIKKHIFIKTMVDLIMVLFRKTASYAKLSLVFKKGKLSK